jgi:hypothetical protein
VAAGSADAGGPYQGWAVAAFVSLAVRYQSGGREVRQQIKWIALAAAVAAVSQLVALLALAATGDASNPVTVIAYVVIPVTALFGIPAIITLAILKYRLYQIDVIINRAVQYGLLSAALTGVYAGIVVGIGTLAGYSGGPVLTVAAAVVIAVLFQPVRHRAQLIANHLVYGERATPYQVLADFAEDMAGQLDFDTVLDRMASILAGAAGADRVEVWVRVGSELRPQVTWPHGSAPPAAVPLIDDAELPAFDLATRAVAVRHGMSCSARSLSRNRETSRSPRRRTSCWHTWRRKLGLSFATSGSPPSCGPRSTTCGRHGGGWSRPRMRNGIGSSATCMTAPSSSSSRSWFSSARWRIRPGTPARSGR